MSREFPDWTDAMAGAGDWTPELVSERLVEAMRLVQRTAGRTAPKEYGNAHPEVLVSLDAELAGFLPPEDIHRGANPAAVTRMEAAIRWPIEYLDALPGPRGMLKVWMLAKATRQPWSRLLKKRGIPLATAKRARSKALAAIAQGLNRDGVPLE